MSDKRDPPDESPSAARPPTPPPPASGERVFEMLWDCPYCGTRGLLGKSHRHCPGCGAPQDPKRRYFPEPGHEIEAQNEAYIGADRTCPACATACSAAAKHCPGCGSPLERAKEVARIVDDGGGPGGGDAGATGGGGGSASTASSARSALGAPPQGAPASGPGTERPAAGRRVAGCLAGCALFAVTAVVAAIVLIYVLSRTTELTARVDAHSWRREIAIERLEPVSKSDWCDGLPGDAYGVSRSREVRSHRQVPDGQDCHTVREDRGDGTFTQRQVCSTKYHDVPVYDQKCRFSVDRWVEKRSALASGQGLTGGGPAWPALGIASSAGTSRGSEREGAHRETYTVTLVDSRGKRHECAVPEPVWRSLEDGATTPLLVSAVTGSAVCDSLGKK